MGCSNFGTGFSAGMGGCDNTDIVRKKLNEKEGNMTTKGIVS
jgi:hypothetical protein